MAEIEVNVGLILEGCRKGNPQSRYKLYRLFFGYGMSIALRYSRNKEEAEEIYNDAFLKVFKKLHQFDPQYPFKIWFRRIVINSSIDHARKYHKTDFIITTSEFTNNSIAEDESLVLNEGEDVLPILQKLSPAYRTVFNLYVMEEYKHHEIAEMLNISVGSSKSNLARAKQKLKELWIQEKEGHYKKDRHG